LIATVGLLGKVWWFSVVAVVWILLYRAAFPPSWDEELAGGEAAEAPAAGAAVEPQQVIDSRPRARCPACGEMVLVEARLCRFCGYRFAEPANS
jgi:predicted RNA-binding Zn-ribbon protein involved in translation (DUF1610 family)